MRTLFIIGGLLMLWDVAQLQITGVFLLGAFLWGVVIATCTDWSAWVATPEQSAEYDRIDRELKEAGQ